MKKLAKLLAMLLALSLAFGLAGTAVADEQTPVGFTLGDDRVDLFRKKLFRVPCGK